MRKSLKIDPLHAVLYAGMAVLLCFSIFFYKQRVAFSDTAGYMTDMFRNDGFAVSHNRFVAVLNQWLPYILLKLRASLKAIAMAYSLNYSLVPVALALLSMHWLKRTYHAVAIMLLVLLMNVLLFYYTVSELQMGLCLLLFYDAVADHAQQPRKTVFFSLMTLLLVPVICFSHPLSLPVFLGWLVYRVLRDRTDYRHTVIAAICYFAAYWVKQKWYISPYESSKMLDWNAIRPFGLNYYGGPFARSIYAFVLGESFTVPLLIITTIALLLWQRKYRLLAWMLIMMLGLMTIILITFENWSSHYYDHYYEHQLQPAIFFLVLLFSYALYRIPGRRGLKAAGIAVVLVISFAKIHSGLDRMLSRQKWLYGYIDLMERLQLRKAGLGRVWVPEGMVKGQFWSSSWETLILSSLEGPEKTRTLFLAWNIKEVKEPVGSPDEFVADGVNFKQSTLPARYFTLDDKPYVFLENAVPDSVLEHMRWNQ